jgi:succinyl-CoA synthetase beta subunit
MLTGEMQAIVEKSRETGWIMEPEAKRLLALAGVPVPDFNMATTMENALAAADRIGYPVVAKVVSAAILHKSDVGGVKVGIQDAAELNTVFERFSGLQGFVGILVEEMLTGTELIVGATNDYQFGPVVLMGIGGTGVEIYRDTVIRMAPVTEQDVHAMVAGLKGADLLRGYRGEEPVGIPDLTRLMLAFSNLVMDLEDDMTSIDLNPVKCTARRCVVADARIILNTYKPDTL